ncbi:hypothetical protein OYT88_02195 [Sporolactobacillus sp. CQH2019]|uniref:hypothetical protein n=1 Tax=Sporolactobacillus sp. CQH2019 TaxID=3023512 RepID=UPI00236877DB|nr:hypothetical protein [Sporolactobacillus sp. CQH2019]MDD9147360.1 hypothetical protein [Sporolactobacillus sp. CQH2019]
MDLEWLACIKDVVRDYTIGKGKYNSTKYSKAYFTWNNMNRRTSINSDYKNWRRYKDCSVVDEWHNFQNFAEWYNKNYYEIPGHKMELDKDILVKGNKIYSPQTCCFVTHELNSLFTSNSINRGSLPIGVQRCHDKFKAYCNGNLGTFDTPEEAFQAYKEAKEKRIRKVAEEYKGLIDERVYQAMICWTVEIGD